MTKKKVLLIDDEDSFCKMLKLNLEASGDYEVQTETKGGKAVKTADAFNPDVIILDFMLPDMDGSDVAYHLQNNQGTYNVPIIFLTAIATKEDTEQYGPVIGGHHHVMAKPVKTKELVERIEGVLRGKTDFSKP